MIGPQHAILKGLRDPGSETELTRVLAAAFNADPALAAGFVRAALRRSKRPDDPRWDQLPDEFECRSEVQIAEGRVDLEFKSLESGWRVLVELKIDAGYGFEQIERYIRCLDPGDERQVLLSITRDSPKYGDPPLDGRPNWTGSLAWAAILDDLRELPANRLVGDHWRLLLDILEDEGSMGVTKVKPELLRSWAQAAEARRHAVAFMEGLRSPLLVAVQEAFEPAFPTLAASERAGVTPTSNGKRPQVDVQFHVPRAGEVRAAAQLWAWEDFRFAVSARYPSEDRSAEARHAIAHLAASGFENWKNRWLWRSLPLDQELLESSELADRLLEWAKESFGQIAGSGILVLAAQPLPPESDDQ